MKIVCNMYFCFFFKPHGCYGKESPEIHFTQTFLGTIGVDSDPKNC